MPACEANQLLKQPETRLAIVTSVIKIPEAMWSVFHQFASSFTTTLGYLATTPSSVWMVRIRIAAIPIRPCHEVKWALLLFSLLKYIERNPKVIKINDIDSREMCVVKAHFLKCRPGRRPQWDDSVMIASFINIICKIRIQTLIRTTIKWDRYCFEENKKKDFKQREKKIEEKKIV